MAIPGRSKATESQTQLDADPYLPYPTPAVGALEDICYIVETSTSGAHCFLCSRLGKVEGTSEDHKVRTGCYRCKKAFHPNCFTAYHFRYSLEKAGNIALAQRLTRLDDEVDSNGRKLKIRGRPVSGFPSLANLQIYHTPRVPSNRRRPRNEAVEEDSANETDQSEPSRQRPRNA